MKKREQNVINKWKELFKEYPSFKESYGEIVDNYENMIHKWDDLEEKIQFLMNEIRNYDKEYEDFLEENTRNN